MRRLTLGIVIAACASLPTQAYRIKGSEDENKPFVPFEEGFVENPQDPATAIRTRVNDGYEICNFGYMGEACESCAPTHFESDGACHPKRVCPNDCSHAGECNYLTGTCECSDHREGVDCSIPKCSTFHRFCTHCNDGGCVQCEDGFSVHKGAGIGYQCEPCWRFDPRCRDCNEFECTSCIDLLLLSIHRSGRRPQDPPLPADELTRELSVTVPFGSQQEDAFYDAEHFFLVDPTLTPLNESAVECHQGLNNDDSITCEPYNLTSHIMCGNHGTITFESPEYAVREDGKQIRLTLQRSGGGIGEVSVDYSIYPITAGYEDATSTAYYTGNATVVFRHGQVKASFLLTINDDRVMEENETFSVHLSKPTGGARLGTQMRTIVTIIDDDAERTCSDQTSLGQDASDFESAEAGTPFAFNVIAKACNGNDQVEGGDFIQVEARKVGDTKVPYRFNAPLTANLCEDFDDGSYECKVNATVSGKYWLDVYQIIPGGLRGYYYTDNYLTEDLLDIVRTDAVVNFTLGTGPVTPFGRDFVSVRWEGYVMPAISETFTFWLDVDDHCRLYVDGVLLIDNWLTAPPSELLRAKLELVAFEPHQIVLEYRDVVGNATARLLWSSPSTPLAAIPSSSLFYKEHIKNSPFSLEVLPSVAHAGKTTAFGHGLYSGTAGKVHSFTIEPKDRFGNSRGWALDIPNIDEFQSTVQLLDGGAGRTGFGNSVVHGVVSFDDNAKTYEVSYVPRTAGSYQLNITLPTPGDSADVKNHIFGSPFLVKVEPGATFAPESIAFGGFGHCSTNWVDSTHCPGMYHGMSGEKSLFVIQSFDANRNRRDTGGDGWKVVVSSGPDDYHSGSVIDYGNGTYTVEVTPQVDGPNLLEVTLDDLDVKGSPFQMNVIHGKVVAASSHVIDEGDVNAMIAMRENTILIQSCDEAGNDANFLNPSDVVISVEAENDSIDSSKTSIIYTGGGRYLISVTPVKSRTNLSISMNGLDISDSPFDIAVYPGTFSATSSSAAGPGLQRAKAGDEASFTIQSTDGGGNPKLKDEAIFDVKLVLIERSAVPFDVEDERVDVEAVTGSAKFVGNGQYRVTYNCSVAGEYLLHVSEGSGEAISESPFSVTVEPGEMSAPHSLVVGGGLQAGTTGETAQVRVHGRDRFGNFVSSAQETIEMTLLLKSRHESDTEESKVGSQMKQLAQDMVGGLFILDYIPEWAGEYELTAKTYCPGGLRGSYYSSQDLLPDYLIMTSLDHTVEMYWDELVATKTNLGASWIGKLVADHNEEYKIIVECNDGGYASHAIDGKYTPWQPCNPTMTTSISMKANRAVNLSLRYKSLESTTSASIELKWESASTPREVIPSRNLLREESVGNITHHPVITPGRASSYQSFAIGDALGQAVSGVQHEFLVQSRDAFGNLLLDNEGNTIDIFGFTIASHEGNIDASIVDNGNGTYAVQYTPEAAGLYSLSVKIMGSDIIGSPFVLRVVSGVTNPSNSFVVGSNAGLTTVTGKELAFEVQTVDAGRNERHEGGDDILATITGGEEWDVVECLVDHVSQGLYSIKCPPQDDAGLYILDVDILTSSGSTAPIKSSPFDVTIHPGVAVAEKTAIAGGHEQQLAGTVGYYESFVINAKDLFGNALVTGGNHFVARLRGDDSNLESFERLIEVTDQGNGSYVCVYRVSHASTYKIDVRMVTGHGLLGEYYKNDTGSEEGLLDRTIVDEQINFNNGVLEVNELVSGVRWIGYISFPHMSIFDMEVTGVEGHCRLWIGDEMVLDTGKESAVGSFRAMENVLYDFKMECSLDTNRLMLKLFWNSRKMNSRQIVPPTHFFSSTRPIRGSPYPLSVM